VRPNEVCLLIAADGTVLWCDESASPSALPDSQARWHAIWRHRDRLAEIVHTHPGGLLAFSATDTTTMAAIDAALGRPLRYAVVTGTAVLRREPDGAITVLDHEPPWAERLRTMEEASWQS
jgi:proteasome lid subunit RPN8/RPN11